MRELHPRSASLAVNESDDPLQHLDMRIFVDAEVVGADASLGRHRGSLGNHQCGTAHGP
jgi:hypothetical protein